MPSARYFRLRLINNKPSIEISAVHLYNADVRVDSTATITSGFTTDNVILGKVKTDVPDASSVVTVNTTTLQNTAFFIHWNFAAATNVNAFKIGSGNSQATFLNQFVLEYSTNLVDYIPFIRVNRDKQLKYPGPLALSDLKLYGESFPAILSRTEVMDYSKTNSPPVVEIGPDKRSLRMGQETYLPTFSIPANRANQIFLEIPGIFPVGRYYFEVTVTNFAQNSPYGFYFAALLNNNELIAYVDPTVVNKRVGICLSGNYGVYDAGSAYPIYLVSDFISKNTCTYGVCIDLTGKELYYHNPEFATTAKVTDVNFKAYTSSTLGSTSKFKFYLYSGGYITHTAGVIEFNFGQKPFVKSPPANFKTAMGPRWEEIPLERPMIPFTSSLLMLEDSSSFLPTKGMAYDDITITTITSGAYYIKGSITRTPDIANKKFKAILIENETYTTLATCSVSISGQYEFVGIPYRKYTILSVDLTNNTVSETIGPIYPLKVV